MRRVKRGFVAVLAVGSVWLPVDAGALPHSYRSYTAFGAVLSDVQVADLNGDGGMDLVGVSSTSDALFWFERRPNGLYGPVTTISSPGELTAPEAVRVWDVDHDGDVDIVVGSTGSDQIWVYRNGGGVSPEFAAAPTFETHAGARLAAPIDYDGDGDEDMVVFADGETSPIWYEARIDGGDPTVSTYVQPAVGGVALVVDTVAADVNGDGDQDVVMASMLDSRITWYEGHGPYQSQAMRVISNTASGVIGIAVGDVNMDGRPDVVAAERGGGVLALYASDGEGMWAKSMILQLPGPKSVDLADMDLDGRTDVIYSDDVLETVSWVRNTPTGFVPQQSLRSIAATRVRAFDQDDDGDADIAGAFGSAVFVVTNLIDPSVFNRSRLTVHESLEQAIAVAEPSDEILASEEAFGERFWIDAAPPGLRLVSRDEIALDTASHLTMAGNASLSAASGRSLSSQGAIDVQAGAAALIEGASIEFEYNSFLRIGVGGVTSIASSAPVMVAGGVSLAPNATLASDADLMIIDEDTAALRRFGPASRFRDVAFGDIDGDGLLDIVAVESLPEVELAWYRRSEDPVQPYSRRAIPRTTPSIEGPVLAVDADLDGDCDIVVGGVRDFVRGMVIFENLGGGSFSEHFMPSDYTSPRLVDLTGDQIPDLVDSSGDETGLVLRENVPGVLGFGKAIDLVGPIAELEDFDIGDIDGDGDPDLVISSGDDRRIVWHENTNGFGSFGPPRTVWPEYEIAERIADIDGDGDNDILTRIAGDWLENLGDAPPTFLLHESEASIGSIDHTVAGDLAGDGRFMVFGSWNQSFNRGSRLVAFDDGAWEYVADLDPILEQVAYVDVDGDGVAEVVGVPEDDLDSLRLLELGVRPIEIGARAAIVTGGALVNQRDVVLVDGLLAATDEIRHEAGTLTGFGVIDGDLTNDSEIIVQADLIVSGDVVNNGTIMLHAGELIILGSLSGGGVIVSGDADANRSAGATLHVDGEFAPDAASTLRMDAGMNLSIRGDVRWRIADASRFDLSATRVSLSGPAQTLEVASADEGAAFNAFHSGDGRFPLGSLQVTGVVTLVDDIEHADGSESLYVSSLSVSGRLNTNGVKVYCLELELDGHVDAPENIVLVASPCAGDVNGDGRVAFDDLALLLDQWGSIGPEGDLDGSGVVGFDDLNHVLDTWGESCLAR